MIEKRLNHEPPAVTATRGWRYHHIGILQFDTGKRRSLAG